MPDPDPIPKLRIVDEDGNTDEAVVRLGSDGEKVTHVLRVPPLPVREHAERLETVTREHFEGRSMEPGVEAILEQDSPLENIELPWGDTERRLAGIPYGWFILIMLALVGAGIWSVRAMRQGEAKGEIQRDTVREKIANDEKEDAAALVLVNRVENVVRNFLAADGIEKTLPWVRQPERVRALMEKSADIYPKVPRKFVRMTMFQPATPAGKPFWAVGAELAGGETINLLLEQTGPAEVKVDWETYVCYQPIPWNRYAKERPAGASQDFRVWAVRDTHFSHEFSNSGRWLCFRLTAKDSDDYLFGYAPADSDVAKALDAYCVSAPNKMATVILRLRVPESSTSPRGVVIEKMVEPRWIYVEDPSKDAP